MSLASVRLDPKSLWEDPMIQAMPVEVAEAWSEQTLGLDLRSIEEIRGVVAMPMGPGPPPMGFVVQLSAAFDPAKIDPSLLLTPKPEDFGSRQVYNVGTPELPMMLHMVDPQTAVIATSMMLNLMIDAPADAGPLAKMAQQHAADDAQFQLIISLDPVRPMINQAIPMAQRDLPPQLRSAAELPVHLKGIVATTNLRGEQIGSRLELIGNDVEAAKSMERILTDLIKTGKEMFVQQMQAEVRGDDKIAQAQRAYAARLSESIAAMLQPTRQDDRLIYEGNAGASVASIGVLTGLLLPAVQSAREAARRMTASNNLKQIALAIHNYHSAFKKLPDPVSTDDNGKPLLSWRVAILPFIEEQALYEKFNLDEPWDSPNNLALLDQMPEVFQDPSVPTDVGETVFHAIVDDKGAFRLGEESRFRNFVDGTSNTIIVTEVDRSEAVPWTAPIDVQIDWDDPIAQMGHTHPGGFHVVMTDGSVHFVAHVVDVETFKAMLTRDGGEQVNVP